MMTVHVPLAATVELAVHVPPVIANWVPVTSARLVIVPVALPVLVTVAVTGADVFPTTVDGNETEPIAEALQQ